MTALVEAASPAHSELGETLIPQTLVAERIHYIPNSGVVYVKNAKVACSTIIKSLWKAVDSGGTRKTQKTSRFTIMKSLWKSTNSEQGRNTYTGNPHSGARSPFINSLDEIVASGEENFLRAKFFSVVRNPYVRLLSAYLDKVAPEDRDTEVWHPIARRFRLEGDYHPAFGEFLEIIATETPSLLDEHFCPQYVNLLYPLVGLDFIGHLEKMNETVEFLAENGIDVETHTPHQTNAKDRIGAYYGPREIVLAQQLYRLDFELFGYSTDPAILPPVRPHARERPSRTRLRHFLLAHCASGEMTRAKQLGLLKSDFPEINTDYIGLDAGLLSLSSIMELGKSAIGGQIANWRCVVRIGQELITRDVIDQGVQVLERAKLMRHPKG